MERGEDWNQRKISLLEQKELVERDVLQQISAAMKLRVEAFENLDEEQAVNITSNSFGDNAFRNSFHNGTMHFHPIEKLIQLHEEKILLYERMLKEKDKMMARLEKIIDNSTRNKTPNDSLPYKLIVNFFYQALFVTLIPAKCPAASGRILHCKPGCSSPGRFRQHFPAYPFGK